jgi:hypothetical protein
VTVARRPGSLVAGAGGWTTVTVPVDGGVVVVGGVVVGGGVVVVVVVLVVGGGVAAVMVTLTEELVEPCRFDPGAGKKIAVSLLVDEVNDGAQIAVAGWPTGTLTQPLIGVVPFWKVTVPAGAGPPALGLTAAINVTVCPAEADFGDASSVVVVGDRTGPTLALALGAERSPKPSSALTVAKIVCPTSEAWSV